MLSLPEPCGATPRPRPFLGRQLIALATIVSLLAPILADARDDVFYKDGAYSSFALTKQDSDRFGPNEHPVDLSPDDLQPIFRAITLRADGLFSNNELEPLFSPQQSSLLAGQIAKGLKMAGRDQDVVFVLQRRARRLVLMEGLALTSGRAFFAEGKLHLIIGEHDRQRNREFERLFDTTGAVQPYALSSGNRKRNSGALKGDLLAYEGLNNQVSDRGKVRSDWIVIDVPQALASINAQSAQTGAGGGAPPAPAVTVAAPPSNGDAISAEEAAALKAEQEAMRAEMARMREQLDSGANTAAPPAPAPAAVAPRAPARMPGTSIEERLRLLIDLYQQGLITEAEYNQKRRQILSEL